jgi:hypothetical protein
VTQETNPVIAIDSSTTVDAAGTSDTTGTIATSSQSNYPLYQLAGGSASDGDQASDHQSNALGQSLRADVRGSIARSLVPGLLTQITPIEAAHHNNPLADQDYSSWGNESFWQW